MAQLCSLLTVSSRATVTGLQFVFASSFMFSHESHE